MGKLEIDAFVKWLKEQVGSAYCWGGQGESVYEMVEKLAKKNNQSENKTAIMLQFLKSHGTRDIKFYDCSGLGIRYLIDNRGLAYDTTAAKLYNLCDPIKESDVRKGDWCFLKDSDGDIYHIGYVVDNDMVVHAFNQEKGVIMEKRTVRKWIYARPEFAFDFSGLKKSTYDSLKVGGTVTITKDIKGYNTADNALKGNSMTVLYPKGTYYAYKKHNGAVNISKKKGSAGAWVVL